MCVCIRLFLVCRVASYPQDLDLFHCFACILLLVVTFRRERPSTKLSFTFIQVMYKEITLLHSSCSIHVMYYVPCGLLGLCRLQDCIMFVPQFTQAPPPTSKVFQIHMRRLATTHRKYSAIIVRPIMRESPKL